MPRIPNFPENLNHEHHAWHDPSAHPTLPTRRILPPNPGAGLEFLQFHRDFMVRFHQWYDSQPFADQNAVAPWTSIPAELKVASAGWNSEWEEAERRIVTNNPPFTSEDELGLFIELGIHNQFLHGATSIIYNEPDVGTIPMSPKSTFFYKIHGLINFWWSFWVKGWRMRELAPVGSAYSHGSITAVSRIPNSMEIWWIGADGSIQNAYWYDYDGARTWERQVIAPAGSANGHGSITAVSRIPNSMEIWWIGADGSIQSAYWYEGFPWKRQEQVIGLAGSANTYGTITAVSRIPNTMEIWWIGANGSIQNAYWYE